MQKNRQIKTPLHRGEVDASTSSRKVYILILNWNNWRDTVKCLESVFQCNYPNFQVVCIDNASTDNSECIIKEWAQGEGHTEITSSGDKKAISVTVYDRKTAEEGGLPERESAFVYPDSPYPLILIQSGGNEGYAGGNNIAIRYVMRKGDGAYIWILNNDTIVEKNALSAMVTDIEKDPETGMVGSRLLYHDKAHVLQAAGGCRITPWLGNTRLIGNLNDDGLKWDKPFALDYVCGASLLVKKEVIDAIGLLEESYFLYWEDADWGIRARKERFKLLYSPGSRVWHKEGGAGGRFKASSDYYWTRNGLAFTRKFYPVFLPSALVAYLFKYTVVRVLRRHPLNFVSFLRGVRDFFIGKSGK